MCLTEVDRLRGGWAGPRRRRGRAGPGRVDAHAAAVVERSGTLDILVNVIGDQDVQGTPMVEMSVEDYLRPAEVGNVAAFAASQLACM
jgi:3-oxoacyl-[acyl-carrier protein] reductase